MRGGRRGGPYIIDKHRLPPSPFSYLDCIALLATLPISFAPSRYLRVDFPGAVEDYSTALELEGDFAAALYNRGTVLYRMGRFAEALRDLERAAGLDADNPEFREGLEACRRARDEETSKDK